MMRRPAGLIALALLLPWLQLIEAQQHKQPSEPISRVPVIPHEQRQPHHPVVQNEQRKQSPFEGDRVARRNLAATPLAQVERILETPRANRKKTLTSTANEHPNQRFENVLIPDDASALATLAPDAQSVRAPHAPRHQHSSTVGAGLSSPQSARSLEDWEVEDFVLLATVDGHLYAAKRRSGEELWNLQVDHPMVESTHHRTNLSILDEDYSPVDHYIWAVEPTRDGALYVWIPSGSGAGLVRTGFTMKKLVEELSPYASEDPPVVYTGDKKTTMITLDAATGRVIKLFGPTGSHVNDDTCFRPNALVDAEECSNTGTITLGRTEYTVGIQRRDGRAIATLKYFEWGPNNFDNDLLQQYHDTQDKRYITSKYDGTVYSLDYSRSFHSTLGRKFDAPVARVFDVARPDGAPSGSNPELVLLPQPPPPPIDDNIARIRSNSIFLNQTEAGSWYALSGKSYPLILDAPKAQINTGDWWDARNTWGMPEDEMNKALVGTHYLGSVRGGGSRQTPSLPPGDGQSELDNDLDLGLPTLPEPPSNVSDSDAVQPSTVVDKVRRIPLAAATSFRDLFTNPGFWSLALGMAFLLLRSRSDLVQKLRQPHLWVQNKLDRRVSVEETEERKMTGQEGGSEKDATAEAVHREALLQPIPKDVPVPAPELVSDDSPHVAQEVADDATETIERELDRPMTPPISIDNGETAGPETPATEGQEGKKKKGAHRGRRAGKKHRKGDKKRGLSVSRDDEPPATVQDAVDRAKTLGKQPSGPEPDIITIPSDPQDVAGPIMRMGSLEVDQDQQLGTGSNGTIVFAGKFDGRDVAVKRMLIQFYDIASQETRLLRESDDHPNVIRYFAQQQRSPFLYIALELCQASLADVVEKPNQFRELAQAGELDLPGVLYQVANGLSHLHELRIVHRDLKPQNILVNMGKNGKPRLLVSDFGLCKKLEGGQSSFGATTAHAAGTSGWRAPELLLDDDAREGAGSGSMTMTSTHSTDSGQLVSAEVLPNRRATRAIDIFSLGLVFFYVLTKGSHPFDCGDRYMREVNIRKGNFSLRPLNVLGDFAFEAQDLIGMMLSADPKRRPSAKEVMSHPFFWSAKKRLNFLCDVSDHFEKEPRDPPSPALQELERHAPEVCRGDFLKHLPKEFVESLGKQRKYTGSRLLDLLRALRNKRNHYEDMNDSLKKLVGSLPEGYLGFWTRKFPNLLLECWNVVYNVEWEVTDRFRDYYEPAGL